MKVYDYSCGKCAIIAPDLLVDSMESVVPCGSCGDPMERRINTINRISIKGVDHKGDASRVDRFEFISKDVETVDIKATQAAGGNTVLKKL